MRLAARFHRWRVRLSAHLAWISPEIALCLQRFDRDPIDRHSLRFGPIGAARPGHLAEPEDDAGGAVGDGIVDRVLQSIINEKAHFVFIPFNGVNVELVVLQREWIPPGFARGLFDQGSWFGFLFAFSIAFSCSSLRAFRVLIAFVKTFVALFRS